MRKPIIVGNWKMNKTIAEAVEFINAVDAKVHDGATYGIATSFLALNEANKLAKNLIVSAEYLSKRSLRKRLFPSDLLIF